MFKNSVPFAFNCQSVRNHWKEYTHLLFCLILSGFFGFDFVRKLLCVTPVNCSGLAGGYLMYPFDEQKSFRTKSNPKKPDSIKQKRRCVYSFQWFLTDWQLTEFHSNMQPS